MNDHTPGATLSNRLGDLQRNDFDPGHILATPMNDSMTPEQLTGKHARLRQELAEAYSAPAWRVGRIDRIAEELAETERAMASGQPLDEQTDSPLFGFGI